MHYYKFNIADWSLGTAHLSLIEEAIYFRLINHYYDSERPISLDVDAVVRKLRLEDAAATLRILEEFFSKTKKGFRHARCEKMLAEYKKKNATNKANGKKGGRPASSKASKPIEKEPSGLSVGLHSVSNGLEKITLTSNHKPLTKNQYKDCEFTAPSVSEVSDYLLVAGNTTIDPDHFVTHYQAQGWTLGNGLVMSDWQAVLRKWINKDVAQAKSAGNKTRSRSLEDDLKDVSWAGLD